MRFKICVSGAAAGDCLNPLTLKKAEDLGAAIAEKGCVLVTGATTGVPHHAAMGAQKKGGMSIGFSPAATIWDHTRRYKLPTDYTDLMIYTGFGYAGRNLLLTRSADAVIVVCGRIGTLNEFTVAFEDKKPIAILQDSGGVADEIKMLTEIAHKHDCHIIYESDPKILIDKLVADLEEQYKKITESMQSGKEPEEAGE